DLRLLVVEGQQARRGQQVAAAVGGQRGDQGAEAVAADADDGAVRQGDLGNLVLLNGAQHGADRQTGTGEVDAAQTAALAAGVHRPLHAERVGDVAGNLDDGGFDHHLGARHVELADDVFQRADQIRFEIGRAHV